MTIFTRARSGSKTLLRPSESFRRCGGRTSLASERCREYGTMTSRRSRSSSALRGARAMHASGASLVGPKKGSMSRGTLSDRSRLTAQTPLGRVSPDREGCGPVGRGTRRWTRVGADRPPGAGAVLASRAAARGVGGADEGHEDQDQAYSSWKRRFQVTASGKFKRNKGKRHKAFPESPAQRMSARGQVGARDPGETHEETRVQAQVKTRG